MVWPSCCRMRSRKKQVVGGKKNNTDTQTHTRMQKGGVKAGLVLNTESSPCTFLMRA